MHESVTISLTDNKPTLFSNFFPPINVYEDSEIALLSLTSFNSFPNINKTNNIIIFGYIDHDTNKFNTIFQIDVEPGCYEFEDINTFIKDKINSINPMGKFDMTVDPKTFKCTIKSTYTINLKTNNSLASVLGFDEKILKAKEVHVSDRTIDISTVNTIKVVCNVANGSFHNGRPTHTIYEFAPNVNIGRKIIEKPTNLIYYPLTSKIIDSIEIKLFDQNLKLLEHSSDKITVVLHIKRYGT